ncbi:MAG: AMP-binding protein [Archangium sp.]
MKTQLDYVMEHEANRGSELWLTQPMGGPEVKTLTFTQAVDQARRMAAYLKSLGFEPGSRIAIFSKNTAWWLLSDLAIWMAGHVSVPVYPTLAAHSIKAILEHSEAKVVFVGKVDGYDAMEPGLVPSVKRIALPLAPPQVANAEKWDDLIAKTPPLQGKLTRDSKDLASIIYTSGSTGEPKGVMHSFETMCAAFCFVELAGMLPTDRLLSYLPLAHVAERAVLETTNFKVGYQVFFAESLDTFVKDLQRARPTLFGTVPRLWLKFQAGVFGKMPEKKLNRLLKIPIVNRFVKKKVLSGLGLESVRWSVTGSAPTPPDLLRWYAELGLEIGEVYGMTENFAVSHAASPGKGVGTVGVTIGGASCKLGDGGEVLVKSPGMMLGYYKAKHLTDEVLDADGWLHTGDRGEHDSEGRLRITGRVKELFKTSKGKYVAPAPIESQLLARAELEQACVTGADLAQPYALVVLAEHLRKGDLAGAARDEVTRLLKLHLEQLNAKLDPHEQLEKLIVMREEWTVDNGMLTPTLKLKRSAIEARYAPKVGEWFATKEDVLWVS